MCLWRNFTMVVVIFTLYNLSESNLFYFGHFSTLSVSLCYAWEKSEEKLTELCILLLYGHEVWVWSSSVPFSSSRINLVALVCSTEPTISTNKTESYLLSCHDNVSGASQFNNIVKSLDECLLERSLEENILSEISQEIILSLSWIKRLRRKGGWCKR